MILVRENNRDAQPSAKSVVGRSPVILVASALPAATIILVRHAERGRRYDLGRAHQLRGSGTRRRTLSGPKNTGIQRIFVTALLRTRQTAAPIAIRLHLEPVVIPPDDTDALVSQLRALNDDETALVVGHSNTLPLIVETARRRENRNDGGFRI